MKNIDVFEEDEVVLYEEEYGHLRRREGVVRAIRYDGEGLEYRISDIGESVGTWYPDRLVFPRPNPEPEPTAPTRGTMLVDDEREGMFTIQMRDGSPVPEKMNLMTLLEDEVEVAQSVLRLIIDTYDNEWSMTHLTNEQLHIRALAEILGNMVDA